MNFIRINLFIGLLAVILVSCVKIEDSVETVNEISVKTRSNDNQLVLEKDSAMVTFAQILSKVTYNRKDVREFLKKKAIEEFDMDNDILYADVKDEEISGVSFREILIGNYNNGTFELGLTAM